MTSQFGTALSHWEGREVHQWQNLWHVPDLQILAVTGSTNDVVRALAENGAAELTTVIAEEQTAGRGQHGRSWYGIPRKSLHLSVLVRPRELPCLTAAPVRVGMAAALALRAATNLPVELKWPNDLQVEGRKLGGILCEAVSGAAPYIVIGIGINVLQTVADFPTELAAAATSVRKEGGAVDRPKIVEAVIRALHNAAPRIASALDETECRLIDQLDALRGHSVEHDGQRAGTAVGLTASGALRVLQNDAVREIRSGTVRRVV